MYKLRGCKMNSTNLKHYISNLPIGTVGNSAFESREQEFVSSVNIENLPDGIVTGSNLVQFTQNQSPKLRSSIALCLLAAQRVADNDQVITSPDEWLARHSSVLRGLNWVVEKEGVIHSEYDTFNVAVHEAIIPFITAALGPAAAVGSLIITALEQLKTMEEESKWITLFDKESRRFNVSEFQFSVAETEGDHTRLNMVAARFDAAFGKTQILFFRIKDAETKFHAHNQSFLINSELLSAMNVELKVKLRSQTARYIQSLDVGS